MDRIRCPWCGSDDIDLRKAQDTVDWSDPDAGSIVTRRLYCRDRACNGVLGFSVAVGFITGDERTYYDDEGNEIGEEEDEEED